LRGANPEAPAPPLHTYRLGPAGPRIPAAARAAAPPPTPPPRPRAARPSAGLCKTVGLSARSSVRCPGPASPSARVDSSVPAATNPSPAPERSASATRGRGLAGCVGRAAADGAGIKRQPRKQLVSARPAPDPAGGLEQNRLLGKAEPSQHCWDPVPKSPLPCKHCIVGYLLGS
ncbi:hypothetical protein U0070_022078, partial [Myodes glareolus]